VANSKCIFLPIGGRVVDGIRFGGRETGWLAAGGQCGRNVGARSRSLRYRTATRDRARRRRWARADLGSAADGVPGATRGVFDELGAGGKIQMRSLRRIPLSPPGSERSEDLQDAACLRCRCACDRQLMLSRSIEAAGSGWLAPHKPDSCDRRSWLRADFTRSRSPAGRYQRSSSWPIARVTRSSCVG